VQFSHVFAELLADLAQPTNRLHSALLHFRKLPVELQDFLVGRRQSYPGLLGFSRQRLAIGDRAVALVAERLPFGGECLAGLLDLLVGLAYALFPTFEFLMAGGHLLNALGQLLLGDFVFAFEVGPTGLQLRDPPLESD
jgi:hypothetical protein